MKPPTPPAAESALNAHTPLPWSRILRANGDIELVAPNGLTVCEFFDCDESAPKNPWIQQTNADLVVTAVNAHAAAQQRIVDLEKALQTTLGSLDSLCGAVFDQRADRRMFALIDPRQSEAVQSARSVATPK